MRHHLVKIRERLGQLNNNGVVIRCRNAKGRWIGFAGNYSRTVFDRHQFDVPSIGRCGCRISRALPCVNEIAGGHRCAIRPNSVVTQREGIGLVVFRHGVTGRNARHGVAFGILVHQAFEQVAGNRAAFNVFYKAWVNRWRFVDNRIGKGLIGRQLFAGYRMHRRHSGRTRKQQSRCGRGQ